MYGEGQACKEEATITSLLMRANYGLGRLDAVMDGKGEEVEKAIAPSLRPAIPADQLVDQIRKELEEIVSHVDALEPRLRKVVRAL